MIEVHLIGYTEDGSELVFDLDPDGEGCYAVAVDPDLLATMAAVREARVAHGAPVDARPPVPTTEPPLAGASDTPQRPDDTDRPGDTDRAGAAVVQIRVDPAPPGTTPPAGGPRAGEDAPPAPDAEEVEPEAAEEVEPEAAEVTEPEAAEVTGPEAAEVTAERVEVAPSREERTGDRTSGSPSGDGTTPSPSSALSPAEIQRRLRSGRSVAAVAEEAGVEAAWIERWLPPIVAERDRVLADAWRRAVGDGTEPLRPQVEEALARRGAPTERTVWSAARRADGRWRVSVRFPEDGRSRSATWTLRVEGGPLSPASPLAGELYPTARRRRR